MMSYIRTFILFTDLIIALIVLTPFGLFGLLLYSLGFKNFSARFVYSSARLWARSIVFFSGCPVTVRGLENVPRDGGLCFAANHCGLFDIALVIAYAGRPFGFIAKRELLFVPLLDIWIPVMGGFFVDRKNPRRALKTMENGVRNIQSGGSILIFPEGTRSRGRGLLPFRPGAFKLSIRSGRPVVPVAISGTYEALERQGRVVSSPVSISFGVPVDPTVFEKASLALSDKIRSDIDEMLHSAVT